MTNDELWIKHRHDYNRKSSDWEEASYGEVIIEEADARRMPIYRVEDVGGVDSPLEICFPDGKKNMICIVIRDGHGYLVNTEGFSYARYIVPVRIVKKLQYVDVLDLLK